MKKLLILLALVPLTSLLSGCLPILVGGLIYDHAKKREYCSKLANDPKFLVKIKNPDFKRIYQKHCK